MVKLNLRWQLQRRSTAVFRINRIAAIVLSVCITILVTACNRGTESQGRSGENDQSNNQGITTSQNLVSAIKIYLSQDGMYEITGNELKQAGLSAENIDANQLRILQRGHQQPLWIDRGDYDFTLRFYGQASDSVYSPENVYWLQSGGGSAYPLTEKNGMVLSRSTETISATDTGTMTVRLEENHHYAPQVKQGDHWLWESLPAPLERSYPIPLSDVAQGIASLNIEFWASTEATINPDHHVRISVNGQMISDESWDGQGWHTVQSLLPTGLLKSGINTIQIKAPGDTGAPADIVFLNWFEISYWRYLNAVGDRLDFYNSGKPEKLSGFNESLAIFDITDPAKLMSLTWMPGDKVNPDSGVVLLGEKGHHYLALGGKGFLKPDRMIPAVTNPDLKISGNGADYIVIGPSELLEQLQPLLDWRGKQGFLSRAVPVQAIYDQFNGGMPEPEAIRDFLRYAVESWKPTPRYVLLAGDATYDPRGYASPPEGSQVPTFFVQTEFGGETASDVLFTQLKDDGWPEVALGRIPAHTPEQVRTVVSKILAYESQSTGESWEKRILAIADSQDPTFRSDAQSFLQSFPSIYEGILYAPKAGDLDAHLQIKSRVNEGALIVSYFGHGSINMWGKDRLFTGEDIVDITNGSKLPVILNNTCLTGLFTHPKIESMAEAFLFKPDGGAIAVLAPTSLTLPTDQSSLIQPFVQALLEKPPLTLGQIFLTAQHRMSMDTSGSRDVLRTFLLFGDPALTIHRPTP